MKKILVIALAIVFPSINAYKITLTPDSNLGKAWRIEVQVLVDDKSHAPFHEAPIHFLKPGQSAAWNQNTIRKEFGKKSRTISLIFWAWDDTPYSHRSYLGRKDFNLDDNIMVKVTPRPTEQNEITQVGYILKVWTE